MTCEAVRLKLNEASFHLKHMEKLKAMHEFYAAANAFVIAARSTLYVAQHQLGWKERPKSITFSPDQEVERKAFDLWFSSTPSVRAVLAHRLADDRREVIHRSGQAGFVHVPKPKLGGMAVGHGTPFKQSYWFARRGLSSLPVSDDNYFYYLETNGTKVDAIPFSNTLFVLIENFVVELERHSWA